MEPHWICCVADLELSAWQRGELDVQARSLGIRGWIVPLTVAETGEIQGPLHPGEGCLLAAPLLRVEGPLTPMAEQRLATQLRSWFRHSQALHLWGRPLLVLQGVEQLSHPQFSLKRLRLMAANLLLLSRDCGDALQLMQQGFDGLVQTLPKGCVQQPETYLRQLRLAHHSMEAQGCWIPAVQALSPVTEAGWREASPEKYQEWLQQASAWSRLRFLGEGEAPVWIESWSGHQRWWQAQQEAPPQTFTASNPSAERRRWGEGHSGHGALMLHGYYLGKLESMLARLPAGGEGQGWPPLDLYVSTPLEQLDRVERLLRQQGWPRVHLVGVANRGRDIAPFLLELLPAALKQGHSAFVKLHTKSSPHLQKGDDWGQHLVDALLDPGLLKELPERLRQDPSLGLLVPAGTLLPMSVALRANVDHLERLLQQQHWSGQWAVQQHYGAGSMLCGRLQALKPLLELNLSLDDFEPETGQTDGTLAHALERWMSLVILKQQLRLEALPGVAKAVPRFGYGWVG